MKLKPREIWKTIEEFPTYEISNMGRVKRTKPWKCGLGKGYMRPGTILNPLVTKDGYLRVALYKNKKAFYRSIHSLVLETFIGPRPEGYLCNHKDCVKTNNKTYNLEWVTPLYNCTHAYKNGCFPFSKGESSSGAKLKEGEVFLIRKILKESNLSQHFVAKMFKITQPTVCRIKHHKTWSHI